MPRFGGYDPVGVGRGVPAAGDPRIWMIVEQRLYLFQSAESQAIFAVDNERLLAAADEAWPIGPAHARALSRSGSTSRIDGGRVAPGDEAGDPQAIGIRAIGQRLAVRRGDAAAGGGEDGMAGRHVPLMGRGQAGIDVGAALGDAAELDRRAARQPRTSPRPRARNASVAGSKWDRLTAATMPTLGIGRVWIAATSVAASAAAPGVSRNRCAPPPGAVRQTIPSAGAATIPRTGRPARTRPRLIVNSSRPATSSRVPSTGSTRMNSSSDRPAGRAGVASSEMTGTPGSSRATPSRMMASEASSAAVTGDWSALVRGIERALAGGENRRRRARHDRRQVVDEGGIGWNSHALMGGVARCRVLPWRMTATRCITRARAR